MARKFWERVGGNQIQFYDEPLNLKKDETLARITELQEVLALPDHVKALLVANNPGVTTEADWMAIFQDEIEELADRLDYWGYDQEIEQITKVETGWFDPSQAQLGPASVVSFSSELVGSEAAQAIDGVGGQVWETDDLGGPHEIRFGWGYKKIIDAIRFRVGPTIANPENYEGVSIWIGQTINSLDNDNNKRLDAVDVGVAGTLADPWLEIDLSNKRAGSYLRLEITGSGRPDNSVIVRDIELRARVRTFGL